MMKIWSSEYNDSWPNASLTRPSDFKGIPLSTGTSLKGQLPPLIELTTLDTTPLTDFFKAGPLFVVSDRLRCTLNEFGAEMEVFRTSLNNPMKYFFCNILRSVDCFDRKQSAFVDRSGYATKIKTLALEQTDSNYPIFRVAYTAPAIIVVSDSLALELKERRFTGIALSDSNQWTNPMLPDKRVNARANQ